MKLVRERLLARSVAAGSRGVQAAVIVDHRFNIRAPGHTKNALSCSLMCGALYAEIVPVFGEGIKGAYPVQTLKKSGL